MSKFVYILERQKFVWDDVKKDYIANQTTSAWDVAVFEDYTTARSKCRQDFEYMFNNEPECMRFEKVKKVEELKQETVVGRVTYTYRCCGEIYKVIYRITKKFLI